MSALIETPVAWVRDPARVGADQRMRGGVAVAFPYFDFDGHHIWGATAMMLGELREVLEEAKVRGCSGDRVLRAVVPVPVF